MVESALDVVEAVCPRGAASASGFVLGFLDVAGVERRGPLSECWNESFERVPQVRAFVSRFGQHHFPGWWWSVTMSDHVGFESWLERDHLMLLDFDPHVVAFASQPFWLRWDAGGRRRRHAPDYFARLDDGTGVVIDVRPDDRIKPKDAEAFEATARACWSVGWQYRRVGALDRMLVANVRWLSGYRHPRCGDGRLEAALVEAFLTPAALIAGARAVGDPVRVLPTLFHLLWNRVLVADFADQLLGPGTIVRAGGGR